jgi:hypothetical protein
LKINMADITETVDRTFTLARCFYRGLFRKNNNA